MTTLKASVAASPTTHAARTDTHADSHVRVMGLEAGYQRLMHDDRTVEPHLAGVLADTLRHPGSLIRARLARDIQRAHGVDERPALRVAVAIEYFHTASLLLDDLPSMDDATTRRGAACPHVIHGESGAILGALALINRAYALIGDVASALPPARAAQVSALVGTCLGASGILSGQSGDLHFATRASTPESKAEAVLAIAEGKTGSLFRLALGVPALIAGVTAPRRAILDRLASIWGRAYQALDDCGDCFDHERESGKTGRRDEKLDRPNLVAALGVRGAFATLDRLLDEADACLDDLREDPRWRTVVAIQDRLRARRDTLCERAARESASSPRPASARRRANVADPLAFLADQLAAVAGTEQTAVVTLPAPRVDAEHVLDLDEADHRVFWEQGDHAMCGVGVAHQVDATGANRFQSVRDGARRLGARLRSSSFDHQPPRSPRLLGGFAFQGASSHDPSWDGFGDGSFVLPALAYEHGHTHGTLTVAVPGERLRQKGDRDAWLDRYQALHETLRAYAERPSATAFGDQNHFLHVTPPDRVAWLTSVRDIQAAIAAGHVEKVVAAHKTKVLLSEPPHVPSLLERLRREQAGTTRFAFLRGQRAFVGATPERLVALRECRVRTEALAGTAAPGADDHALLASTKDRFEHQLVVNAIAQRLGPCCNPLQIAPAPRIRQVGTIRHLHTPIVGQVAAGQHVLDVVQRLHPTPAVGGVPMAAAQAWIAAHEQRGWYAAPVGWFDLDGDGELVVALRCALIHGHEATLFAGAGIVAASDPEAELAETALKASALLDSLRAPTRARATSLDSSPFLQEHA